MDSMDSTCMDARTIGGVCDECHDKTNTSKTLHL